MTEENTTTAPAGSPKNVFRFWEKIQDIGIVLAMILGLKETSKSDKSNQSSKEKQIPGWLMSAFPNLTRDDDNEYNLILDSLSPNAKIAAKEFRAMMAKENVYDDIKYIVYLVELRREFIEKTTHPTGVNKGKTRLDFGSITINDSVEAFFKELLDEKVIGGRPKRVYERQKKLALARNLLPKKHLAKKIHEWTSTHKAETFVGIVFIPFVFFKIIIWLLGG